MPYPAKKPRLLPEILRLNREDDLSIPEAAAAVGVHPVTAAKWIKEEGADYIQRPGRKPDPDAVVEISCKQCEEPFKIRRYELGKRVFCSRDCTNEWQRENRAGEERTCPCGKALTPGPGESRVSAFRKYCDQDCRKQYGSYKQEDPTKWAAHTCENCGEGFRRRIKSGGTHRYCSRSCADRHTKVKKHIVVEDAIVLDSAYESLLWSMCMILKIRVDRYDREQGVDWNGKSWYAPDFLVTWQGRQVAVETKGFADESDEERWAAFRQKATVPLVVLTRDELVPLPATREDLLRLLGLA